MAAAVFGVQPDAQTAGLVQELLAKGADVNAKSDAAHSGQTPLHVAVIRSNLFVAEALLKRGANPNARDDAGKTALDYAKKVPDYMRWRPMFIKLLEEHGAK